MPAVSPSDPSGHALAPLERAKLPPELDGRHGLNRAIGVRAQIAADHDIDAIKAWLARFVESQSHLRQLSQGSRASDAVVDRRVAQAALLAHA
ncbi:integrase family protein [Caballeronia choica]|uniref:Integrase family protein n=1 Tax=Caballeronia choica TaxID=326476 RepID=A0A158FQ13_9BURK|nr:integrase family protein [Caballeronia choica]